MDFLSSSVVTVLFKLLGLFLTMSMSFMHILYLALVAQLAFEIQLEN